MISPKYIGVKLNTLVSASVTELLKVAEIVCFLEGIAVIAALDNMVGVTPKIHAGFANRNDYQLSPTPFNPFNPAVF